MIKSINNVNDVGLLYGFNPRAQSFIFQYTLLCAMKRPWRVRYRSYNEYDTTLFINEACLNI